MHALRPQAMSILFSITGLLLIYLNMNVVYYCKLWCMYDIVYIIFLLGALTLLR